MRDVEPLFNKIDWFSVDQHQRKSLLAEINGLDGNRLLNTSIEDLCDYFEKKYQVNVPMLRTDEMVADQHETKIDVSHDYNRFIRDRSSPFYLSGTAVEVEIPFEGDADAFRVQPTTYTLSPPYGETRDGVLVLSVQGTDLTADAVRVQVDKALSQIQSYLDTLRKDAQGLNGQLRAIARGAIEKRREKLLADRRLVSGLGFKIKERQDDPRTYVAPSVRRKLRPSLPPASDAPFQPEPVLSDADYEHILEVVQNMAQVMERSPSAFVSMDEESLRSHFLVQLNGHYEGQATGETFNYQGKTDILIRSEGHNVFVAECKYWSGPKKLHETIDQLLGYSCWRDTKVAVIIFNRNKDFTNVLRAIQDTAKTHPNWKRDLRVRSETSFRYIFAHKDDRNREMVLTILAFDVPS
jgi:hypothetical protein